MRKMNCVLSSLLKEEREIEGLKRQKINKKMMRYICFVWVNWSYFIMGLLYWGPILEALSFYEKKFWALFKKKKKKKGIIKFFWSLILEALSFYRKIFGPYFF
jgi:hypothetical protein